MQGNKNMIIITYSILTKVKDFLLVSGLVGGWGGLGGFLFGGESYGGDTGQEELK